MIDLAPITIWTDGGCHGNPGPGGWAYLLVHHPSGKAVEAAGAAKDTTNNRMEMLAAINALRALRKDKRISVEIRSDSKYLVDMARSWIYGWQKKGWKKSGGPIKNLDLVKELWELIHTHNVTWQWVKGHAGYAGNEHVDNLCQQAITALKANQDPRHSRAYDKSPV